MKPHWTHITFTIGIYAGLALGIVYILAKAVFG